MCGRGFGWRHRRGFGGPPKYCVCPNCGHKVDKSPGTPCRSMKCPKCGSYLVRGE